MRTAHPTQAGYGLGLQKYTLPCGTAIWGRGGELIGYLTFAFRPDDGRQMTVLMEDRMDDTTDQRHSDTSKGAPLAGSVQLPDGSWVRGRGLRRPLPAGPVPDHGLYLGSARLLRRHQDELRWPHAWIDWPDFLLPRDRDQAIQQIRALHEQAKSGAAVEVACGGGVGRTGTVIACLAVLAGLNPSDAVAWTRQHHHHRAVETPWQRRWIQRFPTG